MKLEQSGELAVTSDRRVSYAEITLTGNTSSGPAMHPVAVISSGNLSINISENVSEEFLMKLMRTMKYVAEACGIEKVILICGYTDLRHGIDRLAQQIGTKYNINPFQKNVLFLFCGRRSDRIKGLVWEGTGFLLLYKRL